MEGRGEGLGRPPKWVDKMLQSGPTQGHSLEENATLETELPVAMAEASPALQEDRGSDDVGDVVADHSNIF